MEETKKSCLYIDDQRKPTKTIPGYQPWATVRDYHEFVDYINLLGIPDMISFSHDLHKEHREDYFDQVGKYGWQKPDYQKYKEKTGLDCAIYLQEYCDLHPEAEIKICLVHSSNPVGADHIVSFLNGYKKHRGWVQDAVKHVSEFENLI